MFVGRFRRSCLEMVMQMFLPTEISTHLHRDAVLKHDVINHVQRSLQKAPIILRILECVARIFLAVFGGFLFLLSPSPSRRAKIIHNLFSRFVILYKVQQLYLNLAFYAYFENPTVRSSLGLPDFQARAKFFFENRTKLINENKE